MVLDHRLCTWLWVLQVDQSLSIVCTLLHCCTFLVSCCGNRVDTCKKQLLLVLWVRRLCVQNFPPTGKSSLSWLVLGLVPRPSIFSYYKHLQNLESGKAWERYYVSCLEWEKMLRVQNFPPARATCHDWYLALSPGPPSPFFHTTSIQNLESRKAWEWC